MPQLSLYLTDDAASILREDAKRSEQSVSRYVSGLVIDRHNHASAWPDGYWDSVYGSLKDPSFTVPPELDPALDGPLPEF